MPQSHVREMPRGSIHTYDDPNLHAHLADWPRFLRESQERRPAHIRALAGARGTNDPRDGLDRAIKAYQLANPGTSYSEAAEMVGRGDPDLLADGLGVISLLEELPAEGAASGGRTLEAEVAERVAFLGGLGQ